ncbi:hypothetical protein [Wolbachia endosymbiont (group A) of Sicus ferrugineus]|uniref:hypothetical protein n=1 Tax=Wolbachia endosymbiont (group A) of Sicus ferrugineus TaxID=2954056 RepID=UPI0022327318|nr:hypothetical protein [Wolbachia endosymbiont (group A) of Sicus ferrugineus]
MSKRKTVLKFSIAALLLGGSSTVAVLYFPYVALAIKFGIVISTAPLVIFAISVVAALASVITLAVFTVSAIRSKDAKGKSNEANEKSRSESKDEGKSLVQEEKDESISTAQQQSDNNLTEGIEIQQSENVMDTCNSLEDDSNCVQNHEPQTRIPLADKLRIAVPAFISGVKVGQDQDKKMMMCALIPLINLPSNSIDEENQGYQSLPVSQIIPPYPSNLSRSQSLFNLTKTITVEQQNAEEGFGAQELQTEYNSVMTDNCNSWGTNCDDSITPSLAYQYAPSLTSIIEGVESGPEEMPYDVNGNRAPYSSMQSPILSSSASRGNSFSG